MTHLIGIGGLLTAGKDEVADYLVREHGFVKMGMSEPILDAMLTLNPIVPDWPRLGTCTRFSAVVGAVGYTEAKKIPEVRRLLQVFGTEVGRQLLGEDVWVDVARRRIRASERPVVLTGVRYPNELRLIRALGGLLVWVDRPGLESQGHASETSVGPLDFDTIILNNGTLQDLYTRARALA